MLAEIALTLARSISAGPAASFPTAGRACARAVRDGPRLWTRGCKTLPDAPGLDAYVRDAFARAAR